MWWSRADGRFVGVIEVVAVVVAVVGIWLHIRIVKTRIVVASRLDYLVARFSFALYVCMLSPCVWLRFGFIPHLHSGWERKQLIHIQRTMSHLTGFAPVWWWRAVRMAGSNFGGAFPTTHLHNLRECVWFGQTQFMLQLLFDYDVTVCKRVWIWLVRGEIDFYLFVETFLVFDCVFSTCLKLFLSLWNSCGSQRQCTLRDASGAMLYVVCVAVWNP